MQAFLAFAAAYLGVALMAAWRSPGQAARRGWRGQLGVLRAVLGDGLLWPERLRARVDRIGW